MDILWAPLQSKVTKDICAHMSAKERKTAIGLACMLGLWIAGCMNLIVFLIVFQRSTILIAVVPFLFVVFVLGFSRIIRKQKKFLVNTQYARNKGYTQDQM
ncbi:MAG: hypothetical protein JW804_09045 [Sedimentisphaerales bacterium]|nr:hypothetical protein [Sedimentisphaerales bacterium]